jgi:UDP-glucose:(heptosyl)LPS alpha-1,3-glucosyltransferase
VVQFLVWIFFNAWLRRRHVFFGGAAFDLVLSPGINSFHPDVVIVHALFHRLQELSREEKRDRTSPGGIFRRLHRRIYYGLLTRLERSVYTDKNVALAAVSQRTASLLKEYFHREDVCLIPNAVDAVQFNVAARYERRAKARERRGFRDGDFVLLLIGNDWRIKGLPTILGAMALLPDPAIKLLVVGNDGVEPFLARAAQLGLGDRCHWETSQPDVLDFYAVADAYVSPTREDSFGLPVAEAMACGLPVITSIFAGIAGDIYDGVDGFVLRDPTDSRNLAALIQRLQTDSELHRKLGGAAAKTSQQWNWDRSASALWELLKTANVRKHPQS